MAKQLLRPPLPIRHPSPASLSEIEITLFAAIEGLNRWAEQTSRVINNLVNNTPADSTASDVPGIVADFNALLAVIRALSTR